MQIVSLHRRRRLRPPLNIISIFLALALLWLPIVSAFGQKTADAPAPNAAVVQLGNLIDFEVQENAIVFDTDGADLRVVPLLEGTIRVDFSPDGSFDFEPSYAVIRTDWPDVPFTVAGGDPIVIDGPEWTLNAERAPLRLIFLDDDGEPLLSQASDMPALADGAERRAAFMLSPDDDIYGLGEHSLDSQVNLNRRGFAFEIRNLHEPPARLIFPFWVSRKNYGVFIDNPGFAELDFGANAPDRIVYRSQAGDLRWYFFVGDSMYDVMDQYTQTTGRPALAPRWTFGNVQSKFGYKSFDEVDGIIDGFRSRNIPLDAVVLDLDWFGKETMGNLDFQNTPAWADPVGRIGQIQDRGIKLIPITEPPITGFSSNAAEALANGLVGRRPDGTTPYAVPGLEWITPDAPIYLFDFTNPDTRQWWIDRHELLIDTYGFDGFWQDLNEPEGQPDDMVYAAGTAVEVGNVIAHQMNSTLVEAMAVHRPGARPFIMSRSGYPGMQRYGASVWSGDVAAAWSHLARQPALAANMGLAGVPYWNSDIGGFNGTPSPELYLRWAQFGFFNPLYRPHGAHSDREPWRFGVEVEQAVRDLLNLRYRLIPHFYTVAREAYDSGAPIMRPLVMDWPDDPNVRDLGAQFLYGDRLMARPVTEEGAAQVDVYLPEGIWYDWFTGERFAGNQTIAYPVALEDFPMFVRAPAVVPLGPLMETSDAAPLDEVTLRIWFDGANSTAEGRLYEDDGLTEDYRTGEFAITHFQAALGEGEPTVIVQPAEGNFSGLPALRVYEVAIHDVDRPERFAHNGESLQEAVGIAELNSATSGWFYDAAGRTLRAKAPAASLATPHVFSTRSDNADAREWNVYR